MRPILVACLLAASAVSQSGNVGIFTDSADVGAPAIQGSAEFDSATGQYKITGSGADIWGKSDQFHYVWREMSGDFAVTATAKFLTDGIDHRKAVIMLRESTDADSPFIQLAIHGNGLPSVQFRNMKGDTTNTVDMPVRGAGVYTLKLQRKGSEITYWMAKEGEPLEELGSTLKGFGSPILVGLGVSSHTNSATNTVLFSNVSVQPMAAAGGK